MDFERARFNMVEQQVRPWNVLDQDVLELLFRVKREDFVPPAARNLAFSDIEIPLDIGDARTGEQMMSPKLEARIVQAVAPRKHEHVLEIGAGSGYLAALLSHRARQVRTLERLPALARFAADNLKRAGIVNVTVDEKDGSSSLALGDQRYEVIVLSGSVPYLPDAWPQRLAVGGRLIAIVGEAPVMTLRLITRRSETAFTTEDLVETAAKALVGFPRKSQFSF